MRKISLLLMVLAVSAILTGCETLKSTISGPFIGFEKDMQNLGKAVESVCKPDPVTGKSKLDNTDAWVQEHLW